MGKSRSAGICKVIFVYNQRDQGFRSNIKHIFRKPFLFYYSDKFRRFISFGSIFTIVGLNSFLNRPNVIPSHIVIAIFSSPVKIAKKSCLCKNVRLTVLLPVVYNINILDADTLKLLRRELDMNRRNGYITPPPSFENIRYIYFVATHKLILNFSKALEKQKRHECRRFRAESSFSFMKNSK